MRLILAILTAAAMLADARAQNEKAHTINQFRLPYTDKDSGYTHELFGDTAIVPEKGIIDITNLRLLTYDAAGTLQMKVTAPQCSYDREHNIAGSTNSNVLIENRDFILSGEGYFCNLRRNRLEIINKGKLVMRSILNSLQDAEEALP